MHDLDVLDMQDDVISHLLGLAGPCMQLIFDLDRGEVEAQSFDILYVCGY